MSSVLQGDRELDRVPRQSLRVLGLERPAGSVMEPAVQRQYERFGWRLQVPVAR